MKIAVLNNFFPPRVGGSAHLSSLLAQEYARNQHDVLVITCEYEGASAIEHSNGVDIRRIKCWRLPRIASALSFDIRFAARPGNIRRLFDLLDEFQPDVIHLHGQFMDLAWMGSVYGRIRKTPVLLSVHTRLESPKPVLKMLFRLADRFLVRPLINFSRPTFVVMDKLMEAYITNTYGAGKDKLVGIPVGIQIGTSIDDIQPANIRHKYDLEDGPVILSVGHVIPLRDRLTLVRAFQSVLKDHPTSQLVVVGTVEYPKFIELAESLGISKKIKVLGRRSKDEVRELLVTATVEVHDLQGLGMGTANLEAMEIGCPVVVAVKPDNFPDLYLRDRVDLMMVEPNEPSETAKRIKELLSDESLATSMGQNGKELVGRYFDIRRVAELHLAVLQEIKLKSVDTRNDAI